MNRLAMLIAILASAALAAGCVSDDYEARAKKSRAVTVKTCTPAYKLKSPIDDSNSEIHACYYTDPRGRSCTLFYDSYDESHFASCDSAASERKDGYDYPE
jgi:hypothetical protein